MNVAMNKQEISPEQFADALLANPHYTPTDLGITRVFMGPVESAGPILIESDGRYLRIDVSLGE